MKLTQSLVSQYLVYYVSFVSCLYERTFIIQETVHQPDGYPLLGLGMFDAEDLIPIVVDGNQISGNDTLKIVKALPAPIIRVTRGEHVRITIVNKLKSGSTSIHWHGIHQKNSQWSDGTPTLTQCPILPGDHFVYDFIASQEPGTFFYHSHSATQYGAGLTGAFIIESDNLVNDPIYQQFPYAHDEIVHLMDWNHASYAELEEKYIGRVETTTNFKVDYSLWPAQTILINGKGQFQCGYPVWNNQTEQQEIKFISQEDCDVVNKYSWQCLQIGRNCTSYTPGTLGTNGQCQPLPMPYMGRCKPPGDTDASIFYCPFMKRIRLRLINSAGGLPFAVWIDRHNLTVVAVDGSDIEPIKDLPVVLIAVGQRIDVVLECNQDPAYSYKFIASFSEAWYPGSSFKLPNSWNPQDFPAVPPPGAANAYALINYTMTGEDEGGLNGTTTSSPSSFPSSSSSSPLSSSTSVAPLQVSLYDMQVHYRRYYHGLGGADIYLPMHFFDQIISTPSVTAPPAIKRFQVNLKSHGNYPGYWAGSCATEPQFPGDSCSWQGMRFEWWTINDQATTAHRAKVPYLPTPMLLNNYLDLDETNYPISLLLEMEYHPKDPYVYEILLVNYEPQQHPLHFHGYSLYALCYGYWTSSANNGSKSYGWTDAVYEAWEKNHRNTSMDGDGNFIYEPKLYGCPELNESQANVAWVDSITIPPRGFVVLRLKANNPGVWYVHCHMEMHLAANMAFVMRVADKNGKIPLPKPPDDYPVCGSAGRYSATHGANQGDSNSPVIGGFGLFGLGIAVGLLVMFLTIFLLEMNGYSLRIMTGRGQTTQSHSPVGTAGEGDDDRGLEVISSGDRGPPAQIVTTSGGDGGGEVRNI
jgi:FtsP/CotA-like multicopper oxidase with cupredoxin domain